MPNEISTLRDKRIHAVQEVRHLSDSAFVLRFDRNDFDFEPGQYINVGIEGDLFSREYSIYSPNDVDYLEVLIKVVDDGLVSKKLKKLKVGQNIMMDGPFGFFNMKPEEIAKKKFLFVASGTGISPFHSFIKSYPNIDYKLVHGIRNASESYENADYEKGRYVACTSRSKDGNFAGRVTDYLTKNPVDADTLCYLCGNVNMIHDVYDILESHGVPTANLHAEVYF
ncbi:MAG: hypothetical protein JEZ03_13990 [Bacteroidales bacterium]|nr:hypothetical protein [Bacteroidales bacterium]